VNGHSIILFVSITLHKSKLFCAWLNCLFIWKYSFDSSLFLITHSIRPSCLNNFHNIKYHGIRTSKVEMCFFFIDVISNWFYSKANKTKCYEYYMPNILLKDAKQRMVKYDTLNAFFLFV
jgi:hypothetical protein